MTASPITVTRCQPNIGAEIGGVDFTRPIPPEIAAAIRAALLEYQVIVFRDQDVTREQHYTLARVFARNKKDPFRIPFQAHPIEGYPEILGVFADGVTKTAVDIWHTDHSYLEVPAEVSILRGKVVPSLGGDTIFSSCVAAYAGLPEEVKRRIRSLKAWHILGYSRIKAISAQNLFDDDKQGKDEIEPPVAQPVVRIHPETRKPALFVNEGHTGEIVGLEPEEGQKLRTFLFDQVKKPDYQMRVRWQPHTIVCWDNRSVQHYAVGDYNEPRRMERLTVNGIEPCIGFADFEQRATAVTSSP
jgi:alpha-ketoglutarate-dependent taurine dioxygenase